jgi:hypothetical protein
MPYAVALEFDRNAAAQITAIAARTSAAWGDRATTIRRRARHLLLAVCDELPLEGVAAALDALAVGAGNTEQVMSSIGEFPAQARVPSPCWRRR